MTTQLWMWDSEGKPEWGFDYGGYLLTACYPESQNYTRYKPRVTDLRPAKVVDADAVVIEEDVIHFDKFLNEVIEVSGSNYDFNYTKSQKVHECAMYLQYKIYPTPPVTEPRGFAAVVEASYKFTDGDNRQKWVSSPTFQRTLVWHSENCAMQPWGNLINPVVISEGQK